MADQEPEPPEPQRKIIKQDKLYLIAARVQMGEAGEWFTFCFEQDTFLVYEEGLWVPLNELQILSRLSKAMPVFTTKAISGRRQILENMKVLLNKELELFNADNLLNFPEGMYNVRQDKIYPHNPDYFSTIRMPYRYDWNAKCVLWEKTLKEIFEGDQSKVEMLQEYFGYCLNKNTKQRKALLLLGESNCGKSTILEVLRRVIGDFNCSSVTLECLPNPQYTPLLVGKMVNIDADVSENAHKFEAQFKMITSGEKVGCNQKYAATFEFVPFCKIVMAANRFPRITDKSSAFYNRLILIPCNRIFHEEEQDKELAGKLLLELPGIFNWTCEGLRRLEERGRFDIRQEFMTDALQELREESNPVDIFFRENIVVDVSGPYEIDKGELYNRYCEWCRKNGNAPMAQNKFSTTTYAKYMKYTPKNTSSHITGKRTWKNLKYIEHHTKKEDEIQWQEQ